ncbi:MAG: NAD(P)/FAD-dependent oxidoreductase [Candidatus Taylorbacteria bacterium]|nr:NAD(P)/FAD-dependent oxidoreductase [Candidatus Taylorbacteria bacterium]
MIPAMKKEVYDIAVIGGGPSGMMAAGRAAELGAKVILIEKNEMLGKKLLLTGGGRCNVTNAKMDDRKLLEQFKENGKFLFSAFSQWSVKETLKFFNSRGMATKIENEDRVFPVSDSSSSVLNVLLNYLKEGKVTVLTNSPVKELKMIRSKSDRNPIALDGYEYNNASNDQNGQIASIGSIECDGIQGRGNKISSVILQSGQEIRARSFIVATGGKSYPETGSTGDGFAWLKKLGHTVTKPDSALVPVNIKDEWVRSLQGVAMQNVKISLVQENKKVETKKGKILFTHFGVSGPTILNMSRKINELLPYGDIFISLDLLPMFDFSTLNAELQRLFIENSNKMIKNTLSHLVPSSVVPLLLEMCKIDGDTFNHSITREKRIDLMHLLKDVRMQVLSLMSPENAIVSSGGVDPKEIDWKTMGSKIIPNLFMTGDILNINRPSGGYSLQLCWTTGFVAGTSARSAH